MLKIVSDCVEQLRDVGNSNSMCSQDRLKLKKKKLENESQKKKYPKIKANISENSDESNQEANNKPIENNHKITKYFTQERVLTSTLPKLPQPPSENTKSQLEEIRRLNQKLSEKEINERAIQQELAQLKAQYQQAQEKQMQFKKKHQDMFADALRQLEDYKREKTRELLERERYRLGEFVTKRDSVVRFQEEWVDGYEMKSVRENLKRLESEREELERQKKDLKSRSQFTKKGNDKQTRLSFSDNGGENSLTIELDNQQKKQRISFQLSTMIKEELDLKNKLTRLEEEKIQHTQRVKKFQEEIKLNVEQNIQPWPMLQNRFQLLSLLGKGGFSEVYKAFDLDECRLTACKIHSLNPAWSETAKETYIKHALRENEIHQNLRHQNIVQQFGAIDIDQDSFCTVLEYCDGSDLNQYLKKYKMLSEKEAILIIRQVLAALHYMGQQHKKIIHYDLKPQNILFHKGEVKVTDFGLCKTISADLTRMDLTSQGLGTYWYLPPECFLNGEQAPTISTKVDVWSVGVIMYEMVIGQRPFGHGMSQERIVKENVILKSTSVNFPPKPQITTECREFIKRCLTYNMEARWDISDAYFSPFINKK